MYLSQIYTFKLEIIKTQDNWAITVKKSTSPFQSNVGCPEQISTPSQYTLALLKNEMNNITKEQWWCLIIYLGGKDQSKRLLSKTNLNGIHLEYISLSLSLSHIHIYIYVCMYVCMYMYTYKHMCTRANTHRLIAIIW